MQHHYPRIIAATLAACIGLSGCLKDSLGEDGRAKPVPAKGVDQSIDLNDTQLKSIETGVVGTQVFLPQRSAVGSIDFNENLTVPVFSPYQGKIIQAFVDVGDEVRKGQPLYTIDSPDLNQAESALIAAAGVYKLTTTALERDKKIFEAQGMAQKDLDQATSDQQAAEGAFKAARDTVRMFGKTDNEIVEIISAHKVDPVLVVRSPISGRVTARAAQPGLLVQPGNSPAPYTVSDVATMWMNANVSESDSPLLRAGQELQVTVMAYPGRVFSGKISRIGATVDPVTHTTVVRAEIRDPQHDLRPGMLATYLIQTGSSSTDIAMPLDGVVREGDGTLSVWVATNLHHFSKRTVKIGMQQNGYDQILDGLKTGEKVVTKGAVFLSNMLDGGSDS